MLTGVPFGIYKIGFGWYEYHHDHEYIGVAAMIWGGIDIGLNLGTLLKRDKLHCCLLANIGHWIDMSRPSRFWEKLLLAVDTTGSFLIVSTMIWLARLPLEPEIMAHTWNIAVISNVLSVGLEQLYRATKTNPA